MGVVRPVISRMDYIMVRTGDPRTTLADLLSAKRGLPVFRPETALAGAFANVVLSLVLGVRSLEEARRPGRWGRHLAGPHRRTGHPARGVKRSGFGRRERKRLWLSRRAGEEGMIPNPGEEACILGRLLSGARTGKPAIRAVPSCGQDARSPRKRENAAFDKRTRHESCRPMSGGS